jgi:hypothetical protein
LWDYINHSQIHVCGNWERGGAVSFLGIHKSDLVCSVGDDKSTATFGDGRDMKDKIRKGDVARNGGLNRKREGRWWLYPH